ncbi:MAG: PAS domain S-box protein, partial [bacterium]
YRWFLSLAVPIRDPEGKIVRWLGTNTDITEQRCAENRLREREEQFRALANSIPHLAWMAHPDGYIFWYNQRWYEYTGMTREQMVGWGWQAVHDPAELPRVLDRWRASIGTGEPFEMEFPLRKTDGVFRIFLTRVIPIRDAQGQVVRWFGTNTDIHDQKQAEVSLVKTEKLAAVGRLAATMAHEINNPLESVTNLLYLTRKDANISAKSREHLQLAEQELDRVAHIAKQTLGFYRDNTAPDWVDVSQTIDELLAVYSYRFRNRDVKIEKELDLSARVFASAGEFRQVFSNLFVNAVDSIYQTGGRIRVRVRTSHDWGDSGRRGVRVSVGDNGCGIAAEHRDHVFEAFYTTKEDV